MRNFFKAALATAFLSFLPFSFVNSTVIITETFEGVPCAIDPWWREDSVPGPWCAGGTSWAVGPCLADTTNGVAPHDGTCMGYKHIDRDESAAHLFASDVPGEWTSSTIREWHVSYWIYFDSVTSGASFLHPIHQKLGKWYLMDSLANNGITCGQPTNPNCSTPNLGHVRAENASSSTTDMDWESSMETYFYNDTVGDPPTGPCPAVNCGNCGLDDPCAGTCVFGEDPPLACEATCGSVALTFNAWHKVEMYTKLRGGCNGPYTSCGGCNDIHRVWIDDVLAISTDVAQLDFLGTLVLAKFDLLGNASATGAAVNYWMYIDSICVGTSTNDCVGSPYLGTSAVAEFGYCGDAIISSARGEVCEGLDLNGANCGNSGYDPTGGGTPVCSADCLSIQAGTCATWRLPRFVKLVGKFVGHILGIVE